LTCPASFSVVSEERIPLREVVCSARFSDLLFLVDRGQLTHFGRAVWTAAPGRIDDLTATRTGIYQFLRAMRTGHELGVNDPLTGGAS